MPLYQYKCNRCGKIRDEFFKMAEKPDTVPCECGNEARKILSPGLVIGDDMPAWMRHEEAIGCLQSKGERRITTRSEYNKLLKERGIQEYSAKREI